jgi:transposase
VGQRKRHHTREFKREALALWRASGQSAEVIERDLGLTPKQLYAWRQQLEDHGAEAFPGSGHVRDSEAEIRQLKRELEITRQERDILKKALGIFSAPPKR